MSEKDAVLQVANLMCLAIRTAPKARGIDNLVSKIVTGDENVSLAKKMKEIGEQYQSHTFLRDAKNIQQADCVVLVGTKFSPINLKICGLCGWKDCEEAKQKGSICIFNSGDLGIAIGSAVSVASLHHVDNRVMYTAGYAAVELKLLGEEVKLAFGIPLSATGKNPFFDRK